MKLRLLLDTEQAGRTLTKNMDKAGQQVRRAMHEAAHTAADEILFRGAEDIAEAGNFGADWQEGLHVDIEETQRTTRVITSMQGGPPVTYWRVFEYGASIFAHNDKGLLTWPNTSGFSIDGKVPEFISKPSVTIPQKFHLRQIIAQVSRELRSYYADALR